MTLGFLELVVLLTTLGGFGVDANPKAPAAAEVMKYAPADADFMFHADLQAIVPRNYKFLKSLPNHKLVAGREHAKKMVLGTINEIDMGVNMAKGMLGMDPINDLHSVTMWAKLPSAGQPEALIVMRGAMTDKLLEAMANMGGSRLDVEGVKAVQFNNGMAMAAVHKGEFFLGTPGWVRARLGKSWRAVRIAANSPQGHMRKLLASKPFLMIASKPSQQAIRRLARELPSDNVLADLVSGHQFGAVALTSKGISWTFQARNKDGYRRALMASEGALDLFRASHIGTRGMARVALAALYSYRGKVKEIDAILQHENELMSVLSAFTGNGKFKTVVDKKPKKFTVSVKATGKKLSDVLPLMGILPGIGAAVFMGMSAEKAEAEAMPAKRAAEANPASAPRTGGTANTAAAVMAPSGLDVQTIYRSVKQARGM